MNPRPTLVIKSLSILIISDALKGSTALYDAAWKTGQIIFMYASDAHISEANLEFSNKENKIIIT